jgi:hypothetical protein
MTGLFFAPSLREAMLLALEETGDLDLAAQLVGSSRAELNLAMKQDPDLAQEVVGAELRHRQAVMSCVGAAAKKDPKVGMWWLERTDERFAPPKQRIDLRAGRLDKLTDEELRQLALGGGSNGEG